MGQLGGRRARRRQGAGVFADTDTIHAIDHVGKHFRVRGPLNVPRPPQGRPLLVQAGSSEDGKDFAARYAEAIFTAQQTLDERAGVLRRHQAAGRGLGRRPGPDQDPAGHRPVIGGTEAEAERAASDEFNELIQPGVRAGPAAPA